MTSKRFSQIKREQGLGYTGYLVILSAAIFVGLFAFKVGPHYFENLIVAKVAEELTEKPDILRQPKSKVYAYVNQAYRTNNLWDLKAEDTITLKRDAKKGYIVSVQYERRSNLFHNIDLVTSFDKSPNGTP